MDLQEGSLDAQIALGSLSPNSVRAILRQVLAALAPLHGDNKFHGGVRPANLHADAKGNVELGGSPGAVPGQPSAGGPAKYMAPELLKPEFGPVGPAVDLYCLGFTALELLMGPDFDARFPGVGPEDIDVEIAWLRWHSSRAEVLPAAVDLVPGLPADLGQVLDRLVKKNVHDRYASAQAALQDLANTRTLPLKAAQEKPASSWQAQPQAGQRPVPQAAAARKSSFPGKLVLAAILPLLLVPACLLFYWNASSDKIAVTIASVPPQAKAFINDEQLEKATNTTVDLPPGEYTLRLVMEDYQPFESKIKVNEHGRFHKVTLSKVRTSVANVEKVDKTAKIVTARIQTSPAGAQVAINDIVQKETTNADFVLPVGTFALKLTKPGYKDLQRTIDSIDQLKETLVLEPLAPDRRTITLLTNPPGATLFLDGKEYKEKSPAVLSLKPGTYRVKAVKAGYVEEEKTVDVADSSAPQESSLTLRALAAEMRALLIGIRKPTLALPSFVHAEADVETLGQGLQVAGFKADNVAVMTQTRGKSTPNQLPSAANISQHLQALAAKSNSADVLLVALVGHAVDESGRMFFCPAGADLPVAGTLVALEDVLDVLANAPAQKKLLVLDCWRKDWKGEGSFSHSRTWNKAPPPGVTILYSCGKGETGYEHPNRWHGAFGQSLIQGLLGDATPSQITGSALAQYCQHQVSKLVTDTYPKSSQVPVLASSEGSDAWAIPSPRGITTDYLLGCSHVEKKEYDKAIEAFNRAEKSLPGFMELYLRRAEASYNAKQYAPAMADCQSVIRLDSGNADAYSSLAESQAATKDYISAVKNATLAADLDPECALAYDALSSVFNSSQDFEPAVNNITKAIHLQPGSFVFYYHRALIQRGRKQLDKAIADFGEAIKLNDRKAFLFADRASAWRQKKMPSQAIEDYSEALKRDSTEFRWWVSRGVLRREANDLDNAIVDLVKATELKRDYPVAWYQLGFAYKQKTMYPMAAAALKQAMQLSPNPLDPNHLAATRLLKEVEEKLDRK